MTFGGSDEPAACVDLTSIGKLGAEENKGHSKAIAEHIEKHLGVKANRYDQNTSVLRRAMCNGLHHMMHITTTKTVWDARQEFLF